MARKPLTKEIKNKLRENLKKARKARKKKKEIRTPVVIPKEEKVETPKSPQESSWYGKHIC